MSAFLFRANPGAIKDCSDEELATKKAELESLLKNVEWGTLKQCTFDFDVAHGRAATLNMVNQEISLREQGKEDTPLKTPTVPGFNP